MRVVPIVADAGIDDQRHIQLQARRGGAFHDGCNGFDGAVDLVFQVVFEEAPERENLSRRFRRRVCSDVT